MILAVALALRLAFVAHFYRHPANILDVGYYTTLGESLALRGEFSAVKGVPCLDTTPGFPLWIALLYLVFGIRPLVVLLANAALGTATGALAYGMGRSLFSERAARMTLCIWALYPYSIYYTGWTYRETLLVFLMAAMLASLLVWYRTRKDGAAVVCGALGAGLGLTNPIALPFVVLAPSGLMIEDRLSSVLRRCAPYYLTLCLLYSPWPLRNLHVFGAPMLTNVHGAIQLYQGLVVPPEDFGTPRETEILNSDPEYQKGLDLLGVSAYDGYQLLKRAAFRLIRKDPLAYARGVLGRVFKLWRPVPYRRSYSHDYAAIFWASLLSDGILIPCGCLGIYLMRGRWRDFLPLYLALGLWTCSYALVFAIIRFRLPIMVVMILFASAWMDQILPRRASVAGGKPIE